jgi:hypothetical protein
MIDTIDGQDLHSWFPSSQKLLHEKCQSREGGATVIEFNFFEAEQVPDLRQNGSVGGPSKVDSEAFGNSPVNLLVMIFS